MKKKKNYKKLYRMMSAMFFVYLGLGIMVVYAFYGYGVNMGTLRGVYHLDGNERICEVAKGTMDGKFCILGDQSREYRHYIDCSWGKFIITGDYEYKTQNWDPRMIYLQCQRIGLKKVVQKLEYETYVVN